MAGLEKVIRGMECCNALTAGDAEDCGDCPYYDEEVCNCLCELTSDALFLLKAKEPVKPKTDDAWPYPIKACGVCGTCLFKIGDYKPKYCVECGRAVKWDG